MEEFKGKAGIIVGGGRGIGRASALALGRLGAEVLVADLGCAADGTGEDEEVAQATAREIRESGGRAHGIAFDSARPEAARGLMEAAEALLPHLDFALYCAGFRHDRMLLRTTEEEFAKVLDVHLFGAVRFAREVARVLTSSRRSGSLVLTTSSSGLFGTAGQSALATAAGGLIGFVRTAATELRRQEIAVNAIIPTARTRLTEGLPLFASIKEDSLTPEHVAQVVCHLFSEAARDVHGEVIGIAGGRIYSFRHAETSGAFHEGPPPALAAIAAGWRDVTRRS